MTAKTAQSGDTVVIHYSGKLESGEVFDTSKGKSPLEFQLGAKKVIPGFENGIMGMKVGEEKVFTIEPKDGYGERSENYVKDVPRKSVPKELDVHKGMILLFKREDGITMPATVVEFTDEALKVDFNHPLAGKKLTFTVKLIEVK
jgi:FKBP-type peptidyl-prolyl cis-trans isomerase 2